MLIPTYELTPQKRLTVQVSDPGSLLMLVHRAVLPFLYVSSDDTVREEAARSAAKLTLSSARHCNLRGWVLSVCLSEVAAAIAATT